jgi:hypothetical protein
MNARGHIAVAARLLGRGGSSGSSGRSGRQELVLLGSALPDLAAMGRFRLLGHTPSPELAAGVRLHHRTDEHFHRHPWFRQRNGALQAELIAAGLDRGPARACSHVGIELLLDGELLGDGAVGRATEAAFAEIPALGDEVSGLVAQPARERWLDHLGWLAAHRLPTDYGDPEAVAWRLHRILAARPRLAVPADQVAIVAGALAARKPAIDASATGLVDELAAGLAAERTGEGADRPDQPPDPGVPGADRRPPTGTRPAGR